MSSRHCCYGYGIPYLGYKGYYDICSNDYPNILTLKQIIMAKTQGIKPGPKPKKEDGTDDKRRRVDPPNQPKHPDLKPHKHTKGH